MRTILAASLLACAGDDPGLDDTDTPADPVFEPRPYIVDEQELPPPSTSLADVERAIQLAIELAPTINAGPVAAAHAELMAYQDAYCPAFYANDQGSYWLGSCASALGARYDGFIFSLATTGVVDPRTGFVTDTWYVTGGATLEDPAGDQLEVGGVAAMVTVQGDFGGIPVAQYTSVVAGAFSWTGASGAGTFLEAGFDPDLTMVVSAAPFGRRFALDGGFSGFDGGWAVAFDENGVASESLGWSCEEEVNGTIAVRAPVGEWFDVRFDGPATEGEVVPDAACDGCGVAFYQGAEIGRVCVDVSSLLSGVGAPW